MDKRITKTKNAIYHGLALCLGHQDYGSLSIGDVLKASGVSRSTFYAHFKSLDDVLDSVGKDIFNHVFSHTLEEEGTHDFSKTSILDYAHFITHILYHLHDEKDLISVILQSSGREIFLRDLRSKLRPLSEKAVESGLLPRKDLPKELQIEQAIESFVVLIVYWFANGCVETPEVMTKYFSVLNS